MEKKNTYEDSFEEYIRHSEVGKREKAYIWRTAIGLQAVDGLEPSEYLISKAQENIDGKLSLDELQSDLRSYYQSQQGRSVCDEGQREADVVSANIAQLLNSSTLSFNTFGYLQVHKNIFNGVFKFAGQIRTYNISKKEWVLRGDSVSYMYAADIERALEWDLEQEKKFNYGGLTNAEIVSHLSSFVANLWQIHAFPEGNTRATAVFLIQYLRSLGFKVNNDIFAKNSWYFRNALVRYIYKNNQGVMPEPKFLEYFFYNLLFGEEYELKNRYMLIKPEEGWTNGLPSKNPPSTPQVPPKFQEEDPRIRSLVRTMGKAEWRLSDLMSSMGMKDRKNFKEGYIDRAVEDGFVKLLYPNSPTHPRQRYLLTVKGLTLHNSLSPHLNE